MDLTQWNRNVHLFLLLFDPKEIKKTSRKSVRVLGGWVNAWGFYSGQQEAKESAPPVPLGRARAARAVAVWLLLLHAHCNNEFILRKYRVSTRKQDRNRRWPRCVKRRTEYLKRGWTSLAVRLSGQKREDRTAEQKRVCLEKVLKIWKMKH